MSSSSALNARQPGRAAGERLGGCVRFHAPCILRGCRETGRMDGKPPLPFVSRPMDALDPALDRRLLVLLQKNNRRRLRDLADELRYFRTDLSAARLRTTRTR